MSVNAAFVLRYTASKNQQGIGMQVHLFRGPGRVFGFTADQAGANLPPRFAPWTHFKSVEMHQGEPMPGVDVDDCLADIAAFGIHVTDAHVRITQQAMQPGSDG
jgi:hypothetical protein